SKTALLDAVDKDAETQATSLRHAKTFLHQANGALQVVDIDGLPMMTETIEDLLEKVESGQLALSADFARAIETGYHALLEYLEELLAGAPHQPVRLFPYYRALLELKGAERIHPADLFFPNLGIRPQLPMPEDIGDTDYLALRKRFERALLPFLKSAGPTAAPHAAVMRDVVGEVMNAQRNQQSRAFWWVMQGFSDVIANQQVENDVYIKQLFARINLQIRRLSEGSSSIAERLLRDALFFIARADNPSRNIQQIKAAYSLGGQVPSDYQKKRYGQIDLDALSKAKERLLQAKNIWNRIAGGDASAVAAFEIELQGLQAASERLGSETLSRLLKELAEMVRHAASASTSSLGLEFATSLLFIENALTNINRLPDDFAERAQALSARLKSIIGGENPQQSAEWLDDISRLALQRQTMTALAAEMQTNLQQVEKTLDEYFRDPSQRDGLERVGGVLHQLEGAFAILDQGDAIEAVRHTHAAVERFAASEAVPDVKEFQQVAQNVGALTFLIESLQRPGEQGRQQFVFDQASGVFQVKLVERLTASEAMPTIELEGGAAAIAAPKTTRESEPDPLPTVEDELARHQQQSAELAASLSIEPDNPELQAQLRESLEQIRRDATLIDNPEANDIAQAAIRMLEQPDFVPSQDALANVIAAAPAPTAPEPAAAAAPQPDSDEAIDAELLEIFLGEAEEVLACVRETVPQSRNEPYNQDHLTTLRRSFHTLKGSSRMVGLNSFGEAGWSIEQVLNLRLSETRAGDADLYGLLDKAADLLADWVEDLKTRGQSSHTPDALCRAAERVKAGGAFVYEEEAPLAVAEVVTAEVEPYLLDTEPVPSVTEFVSEEVAVALPDLAMEDDAEEEIAELPVVEAVPLFDNDFVSLDIPEEFGVEPVQPVDEQPVVAEVIEFPTAEPTPRKTDDSVKQIGSLQISLPLYNIYIAETDDLVRILSQDIAEWRHEPEREVNIKVVHASHSLAGSSATVGFTPLQEVAHALEMVLQSVARRPVLLVMEDFDALEHAIERIRFMLQMFALGEMPDSEPQQVEILESLVRDLEIRTTFDANAIAAAYSEPVEVPAAIPPADVVEVADIVEAAEESIEQPLIQIAPAITMEEEIEIAETTPETVEEPQEPVMESPAEPAAEQAPVRLDVQAETPEPAAVTTAINDDLDADLMPVFLEEGRDMFPQIAECL
ncbi:MAG: response regulator, partial [Paucimonas sp.]|nr:response regulator [Paucimonas sp.]